MNFSARFLLSAVFIMRGAKNYGSEKMNARRIVGRSHFYRLLLFVDISPFIVTSVVCTIGEIP